MAKNKHTSSRAEKVRMRRGTHTRESVKDSHGRSQIPERRMPPVMVRGGSYTPAQPSRKGRKTKSVKRRYDIALATPGATGVEIRLPSLPVAHISWRLLSFILTAGLITLLYYLLTSPQFQVQSVEVQGALRLGTEEINRTLRVYNKPIFDLNTDEMKQTLELAYAELSDITIQVGLPAEVLINVSERVPLIAWVQGSDTQWVDGDGYAFSPRGEVDKIISVKASASPPMPAQVPMDVISLEDIEQRQAFMRPELVAAILAMRTQAPEKVNLLYDPQYGFGWEDPRGWEVYFGLGGNEIETKLLIYEAIVKQIKSEGITPALINVEHVHAPYYRMER